MLTESRVMVFSGRKYSKPKGTLMNMWVLRNGNLSKIKLISSNSSWMLLLPKKAKR